MSVLNKMNGIGCVNWRYYHAFNEVTREDCDYLTDFPDREECMVNPIPISIKNRQKNYPCQYYSVEVVLTNEGL